MKKINVFLGIVAGFAALLTSCSKENAEIPTKDTVQMTITASGDNSTNTASGDNSTKTVLGDDGSQILWSATGEKLAVWEDGEKAESGEGTSINGGLTMDFPVTFPAKEGTEFTYNALYPSAAWVTSSNTDITALKVEHKNVQQPTAKSFGPAADILVAKQASFISQPTALSLQFKRMVAVGKMTIANLNSTENVVKITFSAANKAVSGRSIIDLTTAKATEYGYANQGKDNVVLDYDDDGQTIAANGMTAYFTCWPLTIAEGEKFTIAVETESKAFTKEVTLATGKSLEFKEGKSSKFTVDFTGVEGINTKEMHLVDITAPATGQTVKNCLIMASAKGRIIVNDGTADSFVYGTSIANPIGDVVTLMGDIVEYDGVLEWSNPYAKKTGTADVIYPEPVVYDEAAFTAYATAPKIEYIKAKVVKSGSTCKCGSAAVYLQSAETLADGTYDVYGYTIGYSTKHNNTTIVVVKAELEKVTNITASDKRVQVGSTVAIGATVNSGATLTYSSSDNSVATVDATGTITGVAAGTATITITAPEYDGFPEATKEITVMVSAAGSAVTLLEENFDSITAGNSTKSDGSSTAWIGNDNFSANTAYEAGGAVKIGKSKGNGSLTTKTSYTVPAGKILKVQLDVKGWTSVEGKIKVTFNRIDKEIEYTALMSGSFETKEAIFAAEASDVTSTIVIATTAKRAFVDNIKIYYE